ncbi:MAG: response regulator transcription factor, partial [Firmicutes bacterium]|nr:response regulator transcription factor [Bacillota bacterium]
LIADDHTIVRQGIRLVLEGQAELNVVGEAQNGREAVQKARELKPDVVIMDVSMPELNGFEATRQIKAELPETQVVALTVHDEKEYVFRLLDAGVSGYVLKEAAGSDLVSAIRAVRRGDSFLDPSVAKAVVEEYIRRERGGERREGRETLTDREEEILRMIAEGKTNQEIADLLHLSVKTVQTHRANIMEKLDLHSGIDLVKYAIKKGIISLD